MEVREPIAKYLARPACKQTEVGLIPEDWDYIRLTNVAQLESGHTPSRRHPEYWNGDIPWVSLHDTDSLDRREIQSTTQTVTPEGINNSSARLLPKGTVVFSRTATVGKATTLGREMATSQDFANYICGPRVLNHFLVYLFRWMAPEWKKLMAGSIHNTVYMPAFKTLKVILPPRTEQQAIAEALTDADALIEALEQLLAKKRQIKQGAMQELLTGRQRLPGFAGEWGNVCLGEIADPLKKWGFTGGPFGSNLKSSDYTDNGVRIIQLQNIGDGEFRGDYEVYTSAGKADELESCNIYPGEIILSKMGDPVARACIVPGTNERYLMCSDGIRLAVDHRRFNTYFVFAQINAPEFRKKAENAGTGSTRKRIGLSELRGLEVRCPGLEEQTAIAAVLSDMDTEIAAVEAKLAKARRVKLGMMQELLTGRIRLMPPKAAVIPFPATASPAPEQAKPRNRPFEEAVMLGVFAKAFGSESHPLARVRRTKLLYLLHRHVEGSVAGYLKKAAGPYDPKTRYQGPEGIAQRNGYVRAHHNGTWEGFVAGEKIAEAEAYFDKWYSPDVRAWLEQFHYVKTEELELLTTVDMAMEDLRCKGEGAALEAIKCVIRTDPEWEAKLDRPIFSDANIERAMAKCQVLFGG